MLIRFNVKNFLSFSEREDGRTEEFSMIAGKVRSKKEHVYDDGKIKLLKFAAIYGANASGKSNLVKAMEFMKRVVLQGFTRNSNTRCKQQGYQTSSTPGSAQAAVLVSICNPVSPPAVSPQRTALIRMRNRCGSCRQMNKFFHSPNCTYSIRP